jgi:hypothetical protein
LGINHDDDANVDEDEEEVEFDDEAKPKGSEESQEIRSDCVEKEFDQGENSVRGSVAASATTTCRMSLVSS